MFDMDEFYDSFVVQKLLFAKPCEVSKEIIPVVVST